MRFSTIAILSVTGAAILAGGVLIRSARPLVASLTLDKKGIKSLQCNNVEYLGDGEFRVERVTLKKANGETYLGQTSGTVDMDVQRQQLNRTFPWGTVQVAYSTVRNQLQLSIRTTNTSADTVVGLQFQPLTLKFPEKLQEYDGTTPLLAHNIGDLALVRATYGSGSIVIASEDVSRPLMVGFPWANDRPTNTVFPLSVHTGRVPTYPDSYPHIERPIPPKGTDEYDVSIRFAHADASQAKVAADLYKKFSEAFPNQLKWSDRRPIGAIFLATGGLNDPANPQGWFGDSHLNINTPSGKADFRQRLLVLADSAIAIMKSMNAQGAITWDIEGQKFANTVSYLGDPRVVNQLAPEMADVADEYFQRFRNAGLRVGVTVRPQQLTLSAEGQRAAQTAVADPAQLLIDKIAYAKNRWGITMAYVDSNVNATDGNPMDPAIIQKVAAAFPDVLLIPEHSNLRYYAYSVPYKELRRGEVSTSADVRGVYPDSFSLIYTADGPLDLYHKNLVKAVQQGDSVMFRTWYADPQNEKVKSLFSR
jgi:hypothetical protein